MLESQEREFTTRDGKSISFTVTHLPASKGFAMLIELAKTLGPTIGILIDGAGGLDAKASIDALVLQKGTDVFGPAARELAMRLETAKMQSLVAELRGVTTFRTEDGKEAALGKEMYELIFRGETLLQLRWLAFALEVQFGDFLSLAANRARPVSTGAESNTAA